MQAGDQIYPTRLLTFTTEIANAWEVPIKLVPKPLLQAPLSPENLGLCQEATYTVYDGESEPVESRRVNQQWAKSPHVAWGI